MIILKLLIAAAVLFLGVGGYLFFRACHRVKERPWLDREALAKTDSAKYIDSIHRTNDYLRNNGAKDIYIRSEDGLLLHGLWLEAENAVGTVVLVHGYHSTYLIDFSGAVISYHQKGLNLLIPDQRCHGQSEGRYTTFGVLESRDVLGWVEYHNQQLCDGPVVLSGMSMGASTVLYMADEALPQNVKGIIADCGFTSPADIVGKVFTDVTHLPAKPWIYSAELFARMLAHFSLWRKDSRRSLVKNHRPILMIHGGADGFVPTWMSQAGYAVCEGDKELLIVEGAGHGVSYLVDRASYSAAIRRIMVKSFGDNYELRNN